MDSPNCAFVLSVEKGKLETQAILLVESLRKFGGEYSNAEIFAISPRPAKRMSQDCQDILKSLGVRIVVEDLLIENEPYGTAARLAACDWAEKNLASEIIISLDNDMFFAAPPLFELDNADFFARPVDVKGMCTSGANDASDYYWHEISDLCNVNYNDILWINTSVDDIRVKASYNGGMVAVRKSYGIFQKALLMFNKLKENNLSPYKANPSNIFASTGFVGIESSCWWGSSQAVLSLAATYLNAKIKIASQNYNIPIHLKKSSVNKNITLHNAILIHYHWMLHKDTFQNEVFEWEKDLPSDVFKWLIKRIPLK